MKKLLIDCSVALLLATSTQGIHSIPAYPGLLSVEQPDGSKLHIKKIGDEHGFVILTLDGIPLIYTGDKQYEYALPIGNELIASGLPASDIDKRTPKEIDWIIRNKATFENTTEPNRGMALKNAMLPAKVKINDFPSTGHQKTLVILVEFSNCQFSTIDDPYAYYNGLLNEEGFTHANGANGSARDYFLKSSFGQFDPEFVVVGPITVSQKYEYYGENTYETLDANVPEMVTEACKLVDPYIDFSEYDADKNGYVDNVYIFYAGFGEADSNDYAAIWPHSGYLEDNWGTALTLDGIKINNYTCSNEIRYDSAPDLQPVGIGTFVHEFGHVLGLADHYDTMYTSGRCGVNEWDTMAAASYHDNQNTPPLYSAFERAELGWLEYTELDPLHKGNIYVPVLADFNQAYRVNIPDTDNREYFILETRQQSGWDRTLPGNGLLVWHIDMDNEAWHSNMVNVDAHHQRVDIVEADRLENTNTYSSDPFPGSLNIKQFTFNSWNGDEAFTFDDVLQQDNKIKLVLANTNYLPECPEYSITDIHGTSFIVTIIDTRDTDSHILTISDSNGEPLPLYDNVEMSGNNSIKIESLLPNTVYTVALQGKVGTYTSDIQLIQVETGDIEFFEIIPDMPSIKEVSPTTLTLIWEPIENANKYLISAYSINWDNYMEQICDFSNGVSELPEGWTSSSANISRSAFGKSSPALRFDKDNDFLLFNCENSRPITLEFFNQSQSASNTLIVEYYDVSTDNWIELVQVKGSVNGEVACIDLEGQIIRIRFSKKAGYIILDDVVLTTAVESRLPISDDKDIEIGNVTEYTFSNLIPNQEYGFSIIAYKYDEFTQPSPALNIKMPETTIIREYQEDNSFENTMLFDLQGYQINKMESFKKGIIIKRYPDGHTVKIIR